MQRRALLACFGGLVGTAAITGCLNAPGSTTPAPDPTTSSPPEMTDPGDPSDIPEETSFEVLNRSCGRGESAATVLFEANAVTVEGTIGGQDTCDTARLVSARLPDDELLVTVDVAEEPTTETAACAQCVTDIEYMFAATFPSGVPERVVVRHRTADGESTVTTATRT